MPVLICGGVERCYAWTGVKSLVVCSCGQSLEWFYDTLSVAPWNTSIVSLFFCIACETQYVIYERSAYEVNRLHIVLDVRDIESNIELE